MRRMSQISTGVSLIQCNFIIYIIVIVFHAMQTQLKSKTSDIVGCAYWYKMEFHKDRRIVRF